MCTTRGRTYKPICTTRGRLYFDVLEKKLCRARIEQPRVESLRSLVIERLEIRTRLCVCRKSTCKLVSEHLHWRRTAQGRTALLRLHLHGRRMDHWWHIRRISCLGWTALLPLRRHATEHRLGLSLRACGDGRLSGKWNARYAIRSLFQRWLFLVFVFSRRFLRKASLFLYREASWFHRFLQKASWFLWREASWFLDEGLGTFLPRHGHATRSPKCPDWIILGRRRASLSSSNEEEGPYPAVAPHWCVCLRVERKRYAGPCEPQNVHSLNVFTRFQKVRYSTTVWKGKK